MTITGTNDDRRHECIPSGHAQGASTGGVGKLPAALRAKVGALVTEQDRVAVREERAHVPAGYKLTERGKLLEIDRDRWETDLPTPSTEAHA